jgi:hypothetical protein
MPMLDAYIPEGALSPEAEDKLLARLTDLLLQHEGVDPANPAARALAWVFVHRPGLIGLASQWPERWPAGPLRGWLAGLPQAGRVQPQAALLDDQAAIFYVQQSGLPGDGTCLRRRDAQLQPQGRGTRCHRLTGDIRRLPRRPEHID